MILSTRIESTSGLCPGKGGWGGGGGGGGEKKGGDNNYYYIDECTVTEKEKKMVQSKSVSQSHTVLGSVRTEKTNTFDMEPFCGRLPGTLHHMSL